MQLRELYGYWIFLVGLKLIFCNNEYRLTNKANYSTLSTLLPQGTISKRRNLNQTPDKAYFPCIQRERTKICHQNFHISKWSADTTNFLFRFLSIFTGINYTGISGNTTPGSDPVNKHLPAWQIFFITNNLHLQQ